MDLTAFITEVNLPKDVFYKYRCIDNEFHRNVLFKQELYFSDLGKMNDPFEGVLPFQDLSELSDQEIVNVNIDIQKYHNPNMPSEIEEMLRAHFDKSVASIRENRQDENFLKKIQSLATEMVYNNFGILSLSCNPLNYLMWSHYSNSHTGFCIGFDLHKLTKYITPAIPAVINYADQKPIFKVGDFGSEYVTKYLGTKGMLWGYEEEVRIIKREVINSSLIYGADAIHSLFLGYKITESYQKEVLDFINSSNLRCPVYKVQPSRSHYRLEGVKILN